MTGGGMPRRAEYVRLEARQRFKLYRCRCSRCEHRETFRKNPRQMERTPVCARCKSTQWRVDWYRTTKREHRRARCDCHGWQFPHRYGSCHQHSAYHQHAA